jgi:hypothetical protein
LFGAIFSALFTNEVGSSANTTASPPTTIKSDREQIPHAAIRKIKEWKHSVATTQQAGKRAAYKK